MMKPLFGYKLDQGENAELVKDGASLIWNMDGREQPVEVVLVESQWEEGSDLKKPSGDGTELLEQVAPSRLRGTVRQSPRGRTC